MRVALKGTATELILNPLQRPLDDGRLLLSVSSEHSAMLPTSCPPHTYNLVVQPVRLFNTPCTLTLMQPTSGPTAFWLCSRRSTGFTASYSAWSPLVASRGGKVSVTRRTWVSGYPEALTLTASEADAPISVFQSLRIRSSPKVRSSAGVAPSPVMGSATALPSMTHYGGAYLLS